MDKKKKTEEEISLDIEINEHRNRIESQIQQYNAMVNDINKMRYNTTVGIRKDLKPHKLELHSTKNY